MPYLADAVPGWFEAAVAICDQRGNELAFADHYRYSPDPVLFYEVPKDGQYVLEIRDTIYRGREDFVYRITVGELPFLTSVFPLGGKAGSKLSLELTGWNIPTATLAQEARHAEPGIYPIDVRRSPTAQPFRCGRKLR